MGLPGPTGNQAREGLKGRKAKQEKTKTREKGGISMIDAKGDYISDEDVKEHKKFIKKAREAFYKGLIYGVPNGDPVVKWKGK